MPPLPRKLLLIAAVEGLLLIPIHPESKFPTPSSRPSSPDPRFANSRNPSPSSSSNATTVQIEYKTRTINSLLGRGTEHKRKEREAGIEVYGIAGLLDVSPQNSFLIAITQRQQVALINRAPVYVITDVALIPLQSQIEAQMALSKAKQAVEDDFNDSDVSDEEETILGEITRADMKPAMTAEESSSKMEELEDTIGRRGVYGRFAQNWLSKRGWNAKMQRRSSVDNAPIKSHKAEELDENEPGNQDIIEVAEPGGKTKEGSLALANQENSKEGSLHSESLTETKKEKEPAAAAAAPVKESVAHSLTPKLLRTTRLLLASSRSFFFSYDFDVTRNWTQQEDADLEAPLWTKVDPAYFWNKHLIRSFSDANLHHLVLPLMQGFVSQRTFYASVSPDAASGPSSEEVSTDDASPKYRGPQQQSAISTSRQPFIFTLISRRSTKRAGLRYLRRGIDSQGNVANYVETEQLVSIPSPNNPENPEWLRTYSFAQIRGSIPLYFQQSPYSLRPRPVLLLTEEANKVAFKRHFDQIKQKYGDVFCVSLVERGSAERIVGEKYERYANEFNEVPSQEYKIGFEWFDFHKECSGMRFEKVSKLLVDCEGVLERLAWTEVDETTGKIGKKQQGVIRTNCMDCLDRTNVVESAFARNALDRQLQKENAFLPPSDPTEWFNRLWADNGDAISKQYASTAALKGDFTRTRKRNYRGALTDFGLTMSRYFANIISAFFTQAAIDFLLGNVSNRVFDEFERDMMSSDPAISMEDVRRNAIEICAKITIADEEEEDEEDERNRIDRAIKEKQGEPQKGENLIRGWTFLTPRQNNTLRTFPFEENVVLLTNKALYNCRFDFTMEKVIAFERIDLRHIHGVQVGTYITSTLAPPSVNEELNVGFVVKYRREGNEILRVNTRSLRSNFSKVNGENKAEEEEDDTSAIGTDVMPDVSDGADKSNTETRFVAFKALPKGSAIAKDSPEIKENEIPSSASLREEVKAIGELISRVALEASRRSEQEMGGWKRVTTTTTEETGNNGTEGEGEGSLLSEEDIISLKDAKEKTGILERWGYNLKRFVWA